ncbi:MAG: rRNA methyltransferase [Treponema sp.]|jgi:hypothetical protein|nr:rRNA methyltransferase [Treponema sp.]
MEGLIPLVDRIFPVPRRFRSRLEADVAELSRLLTSGRSERDGGYLGRPGLLSAYLHYFLPWNVYRLCRLFSSPGWDLSLAEGDGIIDLGSGPLTLPIALWTARPELRGLRLEFRCVDRTGAVLEAGKRIFEALALGGLSAEAASVPAASMPSASVNSGGAVHAGGGAGRWTIKTIRSAWDAPLSGGRAKLVTAVNMFNEVRTVSGEGERAAVRLAALCREEGSILVVEPGLPRSGAFIAALRSALLDRGRPPLAPCLHGGNCPLPGNPGRGRGRAKWCHFAFETGDAPKNLHRLSAAAGIPKERAVLSFLLAGPRSGGASRGEDAGAAASVPAASMPAVSAVRRSLAVRIISDPFPIPASVPAASLPSASMPSASMPGQKQRLGRYGCSAEGLVLVVSVPAASVPSASMPGGLHSGTLLELPLPAGERRDSKSGALLLELP